MRRGSPRPERFPAVCPECNRNLYYVAPTLRFTLRCERCDDTEVVLRCDTDTCKFQRLCVNCYSLKYKYSKHPRWFFVFGTTLTFFCVFYYNNSLEASRNDNENLFKKLNKVYPSQRNETWYHFLSVLENKPPSVKSITFLHGEDKTTSDCLISELISQFSGDKNIKIEEITFSEVGFEGVDYGLVLEHYHAIVKKFRVFRADLTEVSGKFARIFHSLCDEVSSDVKPSLFIFTIKYSKRTENLKPLEWASTVLQETWNDLPSSELFPLLSRVIKNVVEIIPETSSSCLTKQ